MRLRTAAIAGILSVTAAISGPALASAGSVSSHAPEPATVPAGLSAVPWSSIGPGWMLAIWNPHPHAARPASYLELVSPLGAHYVLYRVPRFAQLADWSGDGQRVLLTREGSSAGVVSTVDLRTGAVEHSFSVNDAGFETFATFTRPDGYALYVDDTVHGLTRYTLRGAVAQRFPASIDGLGRWTNSWLESPDGTELVLGTRLGLAIFENNGVLLSRIPVAHANQCQPVRWWSSSVILAHCNQTSRTGLNTRLFLFSTASLRATPLTRLPRPPDLGDYNAFPVDGHVYVQATTGCGFGFVEELHGTAETRVPGLPNSDVVTSTDRSLALETADSCSGQIVVDWWTPATKSLLKVVGPPISSGTLNGLLGYPTPVATGATPLP